MQSLQEFRTETIETLDRFSADLLAAGVDRPAAFELRRLYRCALTRQHESDWEALYRGVFTALRDLHGPRRASGGDDARRSLLRLLSDDLGTRLFTGIVR